MCIVSYRLFQNSDRSGKADLGIADAAEGADGDAGRHWSRCCDHACAAWLSWPTRIQLLQTLQRTRPLSYLRASGSATTKGGAASLALEASFSIYETKKKGFEGGTNDAPFSRKATLAMGIPWDGAKRRIWAQADPLVAGCTEDAVRVKLSYVRVGTKVLNTLLLGTFSPSTFGRRRGGIGIGVSLGFRGGTGGPCL